MVGVTLSGKKYLTHIVNCYIEPMLGLIQVRKEKVNQNEWVIRYWLAAGKRPAQVSPTGCEARSCWGASGLNRPPRSLTERW